MPRASRVACIASAGASLLTAVPAAACMTAPLAVYFSTGSAELSESGRATLQQFVRSLISQSREGSIVRLRAHADRSGTRAFNQGLSARRAQAVRDYLAALGVPMDTIVVRAAGEDQPSVETADGVSEPRNRVVWLEEMMLRAGEHEGLSPGPPTVC